MEFKEQRGAVSFEEAERRHAELELRYDAGQIDEEQFDAERQRLVVLDDQGRSWAKSRESGRWLYHDGGSGAWVEATPPWGPLASSGPSPDGRGVTLDKTSSQDRSVRPAEHHDADASPRRVSEGDRRRADQERRCPGCGAAVGPKASFCISCGEYLIPQAGVYPVSGMAAEKAPPAPPPGHLAEGAGQGKKAWLLVALGAAGLVVVAAVGLLGYYLLWPVEAPTLEGRTLAAARQQVGQEFELVSREDNSDEPRGTIISQEPEPGTEVGRGEEISVVVSNGKVTLPYVVGMAEEEAQEALGSRGFEVGTQTRESSVEEAGEVLVQIPSGGEEAREGSEVALVISEAPQPEEVGPRETPSPDSDSPSDSPAGGAAAVESSVRRHYEAIGEGDFETAYSYFGPTTRGQIDEQSWIDEEESFQITDSTIGSLSVNNVSGATATATVDVSFEDNTGTPRFVITWNLVKEGGEWKLDSQESAESVN